jgi:hypothetical protein
LQRHVKDLIDSPRLSAFALRPQLGLLSLKSSEFLLKGLKPNFSDEWELLCITFKVSFLELKVVRRNLAKDRVKRLLNRDVLTLLVFEISNCEVTEFFS